MASFIEHIRESHRYLTRIAEQLTASAALQPASQLTGIYVHDLPVLNVQGKPERQWGLVSLRAPVCLPEGPVKQQDSSMLWRFKVL